MANKNPHTADGKWKLMNSITEPSGRVHFYGLEMEGVFMVAASWNNPYDSKHHAEFGDTFSRLFTLQEINDLPDFLTGWIDGVRDVIATAEENIDKDYDFVVFLQDKYIVLPSEEDDEDYSEDE